MGKGVDFLKKHESTEDSNFEENAEFRKENRTWIKWSRKVSLAFIRYMEDEKLSRHRLAEKLGVTPQYVSKILSGNVNFSFKSIAELEERLGIHILMVADSFV